MFEDGEETSFIPFRDKRSLDKARGLADGTAASSASAKAQPISAAVRKRWLPYKRMRKQIACGVCG